jgi:hypothetical protein
MIFLSFCSRSQALNIPSSPNSVFWKPGPGFAGVETLVVSAEQPIEGLGSQGACKPFDKARLGWTADKNAHVQWESKLRDGQRGSRRL